MNEGTTFTVTDFEVPPHVMVYVVWPEMVGVALPEATLQELSAAEVVIEFTPVPPILVPETVQVVPAETPEALQVMVLVLPDTMRVLLADIVGVTEPVHEDPVTVTGEQEAFAVCEPLVALTLGA